MTQIGIGHIGVYLPEASRNILTEAESFGLAEDFVTGKTGFTHVKRKPEDMDTSDMAVAAFHDLCEVAGLDPADIECLVVCTQNPDVRGLPHTSAIVHGKLDLPEHVAVFDISLGCSGFVYGVSVVRAFMEAHGMRKGVLITADPYSKVLNEGDKDTAILFGDAAAATLLCEDAKWQITDSAFASSGKGNAAIAVKDDGILEMKGRAVFSFAATKVPEMINNLLQRNETAVGDVDLFLLHQGSKYIVDTIATRLGVEADKVPFSSAEIGNSVSSTVPFLLRDAAETDAQKVVIAGFGVGLSWAASILESNVEP